MQVDWITTIAQIINFLVLVYLLKRFLYRPIVTAMERREAHIAQRLEDAEQQSAIAQQQGNDYLEKTRAFDHQREQLIEDTKREAEAQRSQLMAELRDEIATIRTRWHEEVKREQQAFLAQARQVVGEQVCLVARQALEDLADEELERQMLEVFIKQLAQLPGQEKEKLAESTAVKGLIVQTGFPLSPDLQEQISAIVRQQITPELALHFEQQPALICGINLKGPGFKLEWNLESYLANIDEQLSNRLAIASPGD